MGNGAANSAAEVEETPGVSGPESEYAEASAGEDGKAPDKDGLITEIVDGKAVVGSTRRPSPAGPWAAVAN